MLSTELLAHYRRVSQKIFTVVDVETTGYTPPEGRVIEISVLQATLADGIQHQQTYLINPEAPIPEKITQFTGISQAMVDGAPAAAEIWERCLPVLAGGVLTAHNLAFDYSFIQAELRQLGVAFVRPTDAQLCTVTLARLMLPELPSRSLPDLVQHFEFPVGRSHRAEADTLACWLLAKRLLTEIQHESDEALLARFAQQWLPLGDVAALFQCSGKQARTRLAEAGVKPRLVGRHKTPVYQRGAVEQVYLARSQPVRLSWL